mgnify:CR=1 FL=1
MNIRTIQRAEKKEHLQVESIASIAGALKVTGHALTTPNGAAAPVEAMPMTVRTTLWSCVPSRSDKALLDIVCHSFTASLDCLAEPTSENIDALASTVGVIEQLFPNSWESLLRPEAPHARRAPSQIGRTLRAVRGA